MLFTQRAVRRLQDTLDAPPSTKKSGPDWLLSPEKREWDLQICAASRPLLMRVVTTAGTVIWLWDWEVPVFKQERIGQHGDPFIMSKWRTMKGGQVTWPGEYLRTKTLDETLNWVNVRRREMSWTGPRPLVEKEIFRDPKAPCDGGLTMQGVLGTARFNRWYRFGYTPFLPGLCSTFKSHDFQPETEQYMNARAEANIEHAETATPEGDRELMTKMFARMTSPA